MQFSTGMERGGRGASYRGDGRRREGKGFTNPGGGDLLSMDGRFLCDVREREVGDDPLLGQIWKLLMGHLLFPNKSDSIPIFKTRKLKR